MAGVTGGARCLKVAETTTKTVAPSILDAGIRRLPRTCSRVTAWKTEMAELGHADILPITTGAHQRAVPSLGARLIAGLGAHLVAHVHGTDPRKTIIGRVA